VKLRDRIKELRRVPASELRPSPRNWRTHPTKQRDALRGVLAEIGIADAVLARELPDGTLELIDGHLRAEEIGAGEIPVLVLDVTEDEAGKMLATLDPLAAMAEADPAKLDALLREIETGSEAVAALLTELAESSGILSGSTEVTEDEVPEPPAEPITRSGDLWLLGEHRLLCGDSTKAEDVERVMGGERADACVTDPPYGVGVDYDTFKDTPENVLSLVSKVMPFILDVPCAALTPGVPAMWIYPKPTWVGAWVHPAPCGGCPWGFVGNNPILYYGADPYLKTGKGRRPDSVVMASDRQGVEGHPTPKPMKVWAWLVERLTPEDKQLVFDPFMGSSSTIIAAEQLGRRCFGIELSPAYVDVGVLRWQKLTSKDAVLDGSGGKTFEQIKRKIKRSRVS
jgi:ParB-like chromosome segregation protein Spo0J